MFINKSPYILLGIAALLALIVLIAAGLSFFNRTSNEISDEQISLIPTPLIQPDPVTIQYATSSGEKMLDILKNRITFTESDAAIRKTLSEDFSTAYLYSSINVRLEYLSSPDQFSAEILTNKVPAAKNEVVQFLSSKGLSNEAICNLPLIFYLSIQSRRSLPENYEFNPLPENC